MKVGPFTVTRDSALWAIAALVSLAAMLATFTVGDPTNPMSLGYYGIPDTWAPYIRLVSLVGGWFSGKMATSPLPGKADVR
jgi:hypothetical protein